MAAEWAAKSRVTIQTHVGPSVRRCCLEARRTEQGGRGVYQPIEPLIHKLASQQVQVRT